MSLTNPTTSVLITPDNRDFFYVCRGHLKDRGFCSPIIDEAEMAAKKKKEELDHEIEQIKKEYEEKMKKKKKAKDDQKEEKGKEDAKDQKDGKKPRDEEDQRAEKEKDEKVLDRIKAVTSKDLEPRIFSLHKNIYQMRLDRIRNAEIAKRNRERLKNPTTFPSVPGGDL
ncbi:hypothetical protein MMC14_005119 [Varicellaria rhodocarpa]|nr:hypothetical protein [Varicellaria rhodocarpa]